MKRVPWLGRLKQGGPRLEGGRGRDEPREAAEQDGRRGRGAEPRSGGGGERKALTERPVHAARKKRSDCRSDIPLVRRRTGETATYGVARGPKRLPGRVE